VLPSCIRPRFSLFLSATFAVLALAAFPSGQRVKLRPAYSKGQVLRYQIDTHTTTRGKATTPIANPEGGSRLTQSSTLVIRFDVLDVQHGPDSSPGPVQFLATYEKSSVASDSDAYDPTASFNDDFSHLEGHSLQFTLDPSGAISDVKGLADLITNPSTASLTRSWMSGLASGSAYPSDGIAIGQKWSKETPLTGSPLGGMFWRTASTYLHNEPCHPDQLQTQAASTSASSTARPTQSEMCAQILSHFEIIHRGSRSDDTPDEYRRNGLRTSGTWTASGETLESVSLSSGFLVSSTQTASQHMAYEIASVRSGSKMRYDGTTETQSQITLLPPALSPEAPTPGH
jgi:hypothetical protein